MVYYTGQGELRSTAGLGPTLATITDMWSSCMSVCNSMFDRCKRSCVLIYTEPRPTVINVDTQSFNGVYTTYTGWWFACFYF
jgi:hypothetical protein